MAVRNCWKKSGMILLPDIKSKIEKITGSKILAQAPVSGGCISDSCIIETSSGQKFFLKMNSSLPDDMFTKEANGLNELKKAGTIRIPEVISFGESYILLEQVNYGRKKNNFSEEFGSRLAKMHLYLSNEFGFYEDNYIGSTIQINIPGENEKINWTEFYFNKRILFQFQLAEKNGYSTPELQSGIKNLESKIENILSGSEEKPSLIHGDLWGGNYLVDESGLPCLIDPAVYYGHREAELAMTKLFGGFDKTFYEAYNETYPLKDGYEYRENIYKLYHVLNHLNLFGRGYYSQAISLLNYYR